MRRPQTQNLSGVLGKNVAQFCTQKGGYFKTWSLVPIIFPFFYPTGYPEQNKVKGHILSRTRWDKVFVPPLPPDQGKLRGWIGNEFAAVKNIWLLRYGWKWSIV
ncbi:hypothetical protein TNIN_194261 [Trichonephila inaurata madagascariensis]|uniref:Uncharacterized protein n=1 Tax=Trichonephila inaurata madagascariensis TaxID=2747483 RepID=A0A8X6YDR5_9ARAC|nr:hypothetical protein TNIN_194261 [Trichonephila inaurata madagascariensis]